MVPVHATSGASGRRVTALAVAGLAAAVLLVAGCGDDSEPRAEPAPTESGDGAAEPAVESLPEPIQEITIAGDEYTFSVTSGSSTDLRPGWTLVRFDNVGLEAHQVMFARVKDGVDMSELAAAGAGDSSGAGAIEFVDMLGGVSYIDPEHGTTALVDLPEGMVLAMCYVPDPAGVAHALSGMTMTLAVSAEGGGGAAPTASAFPELASGEVRGTIELTAGGYVFPEDMGTGWYHVVNTDDADPTRGLHELSLMRLGEEVADAAVDAMVVDLANNVVPDVELDAVGGLGAVSAGFEGYVHLDLEPGQYLAVDFMPDPQEPRPHMLDGYYSTFVVE